MIAIASVFTVVGVGSTAMAQPSSSEVQEARGHFMAGEAAAESGRWADAVTSFSRSYELSGVPHALYNWAFALRALGRHLEARNAFDELLRDHPDFDRGLQRDARRFREEAHDRIVVMTIEGLDPDTAYQVRIDARTVSDDGARPLAVEADPGAHTVTIRGEGIQPFVWEGEVGNGERTVIEAELNPVRPGRTTPVAPLGPGPEEPSEEGGSVFASPWFWVITVGVLAIAGGVTAYFLHDAAQLDPESDRVVELD
ncbi:MAG: tetratricopeptide repeat protein [Myxococcota bacterium]